MHELVRFVAVILSRKIIFSSKLPWDIDEMKEQRLFFTVVHGEKNRNEVTLNNYLTLFKPFRGT